MKNSRQPLIAGLVAVVLLLTSCGADNEASDQPGDLAFAEQIDALATTQLELIEGEPDVDLSDEERLLVSLEADWVCELQRRGFASPEAMDEALGQKLAESGIDRAEYAAFRDTVNNSQDLRDAILYEYQETCRA